MTAYIDQFLGFSLFDYLNAPLACVLYILFALGVFDLFSRVFLYFWGWLLGRR